MVGNGGAKEIKPIATTFVTSPTPPWLLCCGAKGENNPISGERLALVRGVSGVGTGCLNEATNVYLWIC
ncbi:hypothetical protein CEXT_650621 [Caerostris extrusa]|uniref:Uncharacterized protein n=1 Tax=Caerostris extrusa TaxID=172846 RepID=A0AAV4MHK4_CAEEX|nr:hypothetical protein CEXT_650621 [Caerostris extrusa]